MFGLNGRVARKKPFMSVKKRKASLVFVREHMYWTPEQWHKVLFTDESKFNRFGSDGKTYVRRRPGEEFSPKCTKGTVKGGGGLQYDLGCYDKMWNGTCSPREGHNGSVHIPGNLRKGHATVHSSPNGKKLNPTAGQ